MAKDKTGRKAQGRKASPSKGSRTSLASDKPWTAEELLLRAHQLDVWAFHESMRKPGLVDVIQTNRKMLRLLMVSKCIWAALRQSPRRHIDGKNGALEFLELKVPRSSVYKFIKTDLGLKHVDDLCVCATMEEVIEACHKLKEMTCEVRHCYEKYAEQIHSQTQSASKPPKTRRRAKDRDLVPVGRG